MNVGSRVIDEDHPPYVIAEIGVNHDGSVDRALALVDRARAAGADAAKLQHFEANRLLSRAARLAAYQARSGARDPGEMLGRLELSLDETGRVLRHASEAGLHAIVSVFSIEHVEALDALGVDAWKVASPDLVHRPLLERLMATGRPMLVSTGAASLAEVRETAGWLGDHPHVLMHCVSAYPTPDGSAALGGLIAMRRVVPTALGYSDHTTSLDTGALAVAAGACALEKHFTHDRDAAGPDHAASLDADGLAEYVHRARSAWTMRGPIEKRVLPIEEEVRMISRQSLTTTRALPAGHRLAAGDLTIKRPGTGIPPARLAEVIERRTSRPLEADMPLEDGDLA